MVKGKSLMWALMVCCTLVSASVLAADWGLKKGEVELQSAGQLTFGPDGILIVGDPKAATIYAVDTGVSSGNPAEVKLKVEGLTKQIAAAIEADSVSIVDMAVNPTSGDVYFSVSTGDGAALARLSPDGKITRVDTKEVAHSKVTLPNAPEDKITGEGRRRGNKRLQSITDIAYVDNKVLVSGLSSADSPSTVREIPFPFLEADPGVSLEIYHAAHGRTEDYAPIQTFVPFNIDGEPNVLAGFTCTPLVKFPVKELTKGERIQGTTVAELGNRNRPLDTIVYEKDGKRFLLMANSARGVMKISTEGIEKNKGLNERVGGGGTAGQPYETIEALTGVVQLDKLNDTSAVVVAETDGGAVNLSTVALP